MSGHGPGCWASSSSLEFCPHKKARFRGRCWSSFADLRAAGHRDVACISSWTPDQKDFCTWVVFLSHGSLGNEAVGEHKVSWGKCKIGVLFLRGPAGPEGVGSLGSMCSLELLNPAGSTQGLERARLNLLGVWGHDDKHSTPFPGQIWKKRNSCSQQKRENKCIHFSFSLIHSENEQ